MPSPERWVGRMFFSRGRPLYGGHLAPTELHAHHAHQIVLSIHGLLELADASAGIVRCRAAVIPADAPHAIHAPIRSALVLWLDPHELAGRQLGRVVQRSERATDWVRDDSFADVYGEIPGNWDEALETEAAILRALHLDDVRPRVVHPGIVRTLRTVAERRAGTLRLAELARDAGLSSGRLVHLFREQVGLPLRPYMLWSRLVRAIEQVRAGASLTRAAQAAGFSDSSHMTRTFHRMFGLSPSEAMGGLEWMTR